MMKRNTGMDHSLQIGGQGASPKTLDLIKAMLSKGMRPPKGMKLPTTGMKMKSMKLSDILG